MESALLAQSQIYFLTFLRWHYPHQVWRKKRLRVRKIPSQQDP